MLSDVEYFNARIGKIDGSDDLGDHLIQVVKAKTIVAEQNGSAKVDPSTEKSPPVPEKDTPAAENEPDESTES
jgi:vacuolar protein sorting-associated protein 54